MELIVKHKKIRRAFKAHGALPKLFLFAVVKSHIKLVKNYLGISPSNF